MTVEDLNNILLSEECKNVRIDIDGDRKVNVYVNEENVGIVDNLLDLPEEVFHIKHSEYIQNMC